MNKITEKKCTGPCSLVKTINEFYIDRNPKSKSGYRSQCKTCIIESRTEYYYNNKKLRTKYLIDNAETTAITRAAYRKNNKEKIAIQVARARKKNPELFRKRNSDYKSNNKDKINAATAKRRAAKLQRTVAWADLGKIRDIYDQCIEINLTAKTAGCTEIFVVDHVIPLVGKLVSGLHVENNLQIMTLKDNCRKHNKFIPG